MLDAECVRVGVRRGVFVELKMEGAKEGRARERALNRGE